jgi:predicted nucleic acid-binding protein
MIVVDANVIVSGLRSRTGSSHVVLRGMFTGDFSFAISPAVALEYEAVLKRPRILGPEPWIGPEDLEELLDAICILGMPTVPWFRLRPLLSDPKLT